ncbi:MAG: histidine phosphatase family protein [Acidimicrobiales bacterium]|nr:histidine phosphatase family protein [Acidimicrobiales bacterium]
MSHLTRMLLARHGESEWNALGRWQGQADPPLSPMGRRQAALAADRLGAIDVIVSSDLSRALRTAHVIAELLGVGPVIVEPRLRERDVGAWSGLTREQIEATFPGYLDDGRRPPGWEPDELLLERSSEALDAIERTYCGAEILVVTHGGVIYNLERHHGLTPTRLANLEGRWVAHHGNRVVLGERIRLVDDHTGTEGCTTPQDGATNSYS